MDFLSFDSPTNASYRIAVPVPARCAICPARPTRRQERSSVPRSDATILGATPGCWPAGLGWTPTVRREAAGVFGG